MKALKKTYEHMKFDLSNYQDNLPPSVKQEIMEGLWNSKSILQRIKMVSFIHHILIGSQYKIVSNDEIYGITEEFEVYDVLLDMNLSM